MCLVGAEYWRDTKGRHMSSKNIAKATRATHILETSGCDGEFERAVGKVI